MCARWVRLGWFVGAAAALIVGQPARATWRGANDRIAWTQALNPESWAQSPIVVATVPLTNPIPFEVHFSPSWSPDGSKLVFISRSPAHEYRIEQINADGSGR